MRGPGEPNIQGTAVVHQGARKLQTTPLIDKYCTSRKGINQLLSGALLQGADLGVSSSTCQFLWQSR